MRFIARQNWISVPDLVTHQPMGRLVLHSLEFGEDRFMDVKCTALKVDNFIFIH